MDSRQARRSGVEASKKLGRVVAHESPRACGFGNYVSHEVEKLTVGELVEGEV
jgi:hypothetical protein